MFKYILNKVVYLYTIDPSHDVDNKGHCQLITHLFNDITKLVKCICTSELYSFVYSISINIVDIQIREISLKTGF